MAYLGWNILPSPFTSLFLPYGQQLTCRSCVCWWFVYIVFILEFVGNFATQFLLFCGSCIQVFGFVICFVSFYVGIQEGPQSVLSPTPIFSESHQLVDFVCVCMCLFLMWCEKSEDEVNLFDKLVSAMTFFDQYKSLCLIKTLVLVFISLINDYYRKFNLQS